MIIYCKGDIMQPKYLNLLKNDPEFKALVLDPIILDMACAISDPSILDDSWEIISKSSSFYLEKGGRAAITIGGPYQALKFHLGVS
jgi:hypothetical protein